jgi:hypothetical protein
MALSATGMDPMGISGESRKFYARFTLLPTIVFSHGAVRSFRGCFLDHYDIRLWSNVACVNANDPESAPIQARMEEMFLKTLEAGKEVQYASKSSRETDGRKSGMSQGAADQQKTSKITESKKSQSLSTEEKTPPTATASESKNAALADHLLTRKVGKHIISADLIWSDMIMEGAARIAAEGSVTAMEVGMFHARQCTEAAQKGLQAHCVEAAPTAMSRVNDWISLQSQEIRQRIHVYNMAAGDSSGGKVPFFTASSTGDHVGDFDMWNSTYNERESKRYHLTHLHFYFLSESWNKRQRVTQSKEGQAQSKAGQACRSTYCRT